MNNALYSNQENATLRKDLALSKNIIRKETFEDLEQLWHSEFGVVRTQRALFTQMVRLAKADGISFTVESAPKRIRRPYNRKSRASEKTKQHRILREKIATILRTASLSAERKIIRRLTGMLSDIFVENDTLKKEIRELKEFKRNAILSKGDRHSPLMEQYFDGGIDR